MGNPRRQGRDYRESVLTLIGMKHTCPYLTVSARETDKPHFCLLIFLAQSILICEGGLIVSVSELCGGGQCRQERWKVMGKYINVNNLYLYLIYI